MLASARLGVQAPFTVFFKRCCTVAQVLISPRPVAYLDLIASERSGLNIDRAVGAAAGPRRCQGPVEEEENNDVFVNAIPRGRVGKVG